MKLYCINRLGSIGRSANKTSVSMLRDACEQRNIKFIEVISNNFDFSSPIQLSKNDLLYKVTTDSLSGQLERLHLTMHPTTFYMGEIGFWRQDNVVTSNLVHLSHGLPINKTVFGVSDNRKMLTNAVEKLGGFPIIIKISGGSHGIGIIRADSLPSLITIVDYIKKKKDTRFILRQYLAHSSSARLIVLGDQVIDSIKYEARGIDFRTNATKSPSVEPKDFGDRVNAVAVKSVNVLGLEFGGVDIIVDENGNPSILEVNFPCFFPRAQQVSGTDIAGKMVDFLKNKSMNTED